MKRAFKIHPTDNVATALDDLVAGDDVHVLNDLEATRLVALEAVPAHHKIALCDLTTNESILKFAVPIGYATTPIARGAWIHLHNCTSGYDERSQTLDLHTGGSTDVRYE